MGWEEMICACLGNTQIFNGGNLMSCNSRLEKKIDINGARPSKCSTLFFSVAKNSPRRSSSRSLRGFR